VTIHRIPITSREMWLANRLRDVTASSVACLITEHEYVTPFGLYALKTGQIQEEADEPVLTENSLTLSPMGRGNLLEAAAGDMLRQLKPEWIVKKCSDYLRDDSVRLGATPDFECNDPARGQGIVQIKVPEQSIFRKKWLQEDGEIVPPMAYCIQAMVEAHLTGAKWAAVGVMTVGHRTQFQLIDVPIHKGVIDAVYEAVDEFWDRVAKNEPYDPDYQRDGTTITRLTHPDGEVIDLSAWNEAGSLAMEDTRLKDEIKESEARRKAIKAEVMHRMGNASVATIGGKTFAVSKTVKRGGYEVKPTEYNTLTIKGV
jgi:predicted phage-related endonuclease